MTDHSSTRDRLDGTIDEGKGNLKQAWGDATGDDQTKAEGMVDEAKGQAKQALGDLKDAAGNLKDAAKDATS